MVLSEMSVSCRLFSISILLVEKMLMQNKPNCLIIPDILPIRIEAPGEEQKASFSYQVCSRCWQFGLLLTKQQCFDEHFEMMSICLRN